MDTTERRQTEKATRPASRWRNRYEALCDFTHSNSTISRQRGEEMWGTVEWPSKDVAETYGRDWEAKYFSFVKHTGAFPVEGA